MQKIAPAKKYPSVVVRIVSLHNAMHTERVRAKIRDTRQTEGGGWGLGVVELVPVACGLSVIVVWVLRQFTRRAPMHVADLVQGD